LSDLTRKDLSNPASDSLVNKAVSDKADFIAVLNVKIPLEDVRFKEELHIEQFCASYYNGIVASNPPASIKSLLVPQLVASQGLTT
jgi:hypothetical protein